MSDQADALKRQLLNLTRAFLKEMGADRAARSVQMGAALMDDLGLGSLERAAYLQFLEQHFAVRLNPHDMMAADHMGDVYALLQKAIPQSRVSSSENESSSQQEAIPVVDLAADHAPVQLDDCQTLVEVLQRYADADPDRLHACLLSSSGDPIRLTYGDLWRRVQIRAAQLHRSGLPAGAVIAIAVLAADAFMVNYLAVVMAGYHPLVMRLPIQRQGLRPLYWRIRLPMLLANDAVAVLVENDETEKLLTQLSQVLAPSLVIFNDVSFEEGLLPVLGPVNSFPEQVIYQRLVWHHQEKLSLAVNHQQWLQRVREDGKQLQVKSSDVVFSWLSLVEPVGCLSAWLGSLYYGLPFIFLPPENFLAQPGRWLWGIHQYRASISFAPNAGFALCLRYLTETSCTGLDLSSWRIALNAGESIHARCVQQFCQRFSAFGFSERAMHQAYVPAGTAILLTLSRSSRHPHYERISSQLFFKARRAQLLPSDHSGGLMFVTLGAVLSGREIRIVEPDGALLAERHIGLVQYRLCEGDRQSSWQQTGDLGYLADSSLYVVAPDGQKVVKWGSYVSDHALSMVISAVPALAKSSFLYFCVDDQERGEAQWLLLIAGKKWLRLSSAKRLRSSLQHRLMQCFGVVPDHILFLKKEALKRFGSTLEERTQAASAAYLAGDLLPSPPWYHHRRLREKLKALGASILKPVRCLAKIFYSIYFLLWMLVLFLPTWLVVMALPRTIGKKIFKLFCKTLFLCVLCPVFVKGRHNLRGKGPFIFAPNHTSYLDVLALISALPSQACFVGKRELKAIPLLGSIFKKMGHLFVDPADFVRGKENLQQITDTLKTHSIVIYPEGTFTHATGLRPFKLGAFTAAAQTDTPVCPVICKGLRKVFRDREALLCPGVVRIIAKPHLRAKANDISSVVRLRDEVMASIAEDCGEPLLELIAAGPPVAG